MSTMIRPTFPATVPGQLLGARQLADVVRRVAASPAEWLTRVRLNPAGRWYERIRVAYPPSSFGTVFPFRRVFTVAHRAKLPGFSY